VPKTQVQNADTCESSVGSVEAKRVRAVGA
jgi:hypothetical protein